jgi:hypothetical protein
MENENENQIPLNAEVGPPDTSVAKPKRVLTEAQRLAFMKGREKRLSNIARRKEEQQEVQEMEEVPPTPHKNIIPPKPRVVRAKPIDTPVDDDDGLGDNIPDMPPLKRETKTDDDPHHHTAKKIADMVMEQMRARDAELMPPPKKRVPRAPRKPVVARRYESPPDSPSSGSSGGYDIPQRTFNWM